MEWPPEVGSLIPRCAEEPTHSWAPSASSILLPGPKDMRPSVSLNLPISILGVAHLVPRLHTGHSSGSLVGGHHLICASHFLKGQSRALLGSVGLSKPCLFLMVEWHHRVRVPPHQYRCGHSWHRWFPKTEELILPVRSGTHLRPLGGFWVRDTKHFTL